MTIKFRLVKGNVFGLPEGAHPTKTQYVTGERRHRTRIVGHIGLVNTGETYRGMGLKDLQRRLEYWETRVDDFAAVAASAEGEAKKSAAKLLKDGEKLLKTLRGQINEKTVA